MRIFFLWLACIFSFVSDGFAQPSNFIELWKEYGGKVRELPSQPGRTSDSPRPTQEGSFIGKKVSPATSSQGITTELEFGNYWALVIGIDNYRSLPKLKTAVSDAVAVASILKNKYDFRVKSLLNASRDQILDALDDIRSRLLFRDNLLIYYAGHGWLDEQADQGFWLPVDADKHRRSRWIANEVITGSVKAIEAKHVLIVADSCYSGKLVRGVRIRKINRENVNYLKNVYRKRARVVITSGGLEPVYDGQGPHSPFAASFLAALDANDGVIDSSQLFNRIRRPVMLASDQSPQYSDLRKAGHDGGEFIFVKRRQSSVHIFRPEKGAKDG